MTMASNLANTWPCEPMPLRADGLLAGQNPANAPITEFTQFETRVFHVTEQARQALCVAFDVVPGCADHRGSFHRRTGLRPPQWYVVERIAHHKWNAGGFDRSLGVSNTVSLKVSRDGHDSTEDATVFGRLLLDTLDVVALVPHADLRSDVLSLGGQARAVPDKVVLRDGTVLTPSNADLGQPQATFGG